MYIVLRDPTTNKVTSIYNTVTGESFTKDIYNREYRKFLVWNSQQEVPLDISDQ